MSRVIIGLTGPMCAGKNRAAEILEKKGFATIDADTVAHQALLDVQDTVLSAFGKIAKEKGIELRSSDGSIHRRSLGMLVFSSPELLSLLESITYPRINELLNLFIDSHPDQSVVINAPLLHKSPVVFRCTFVIFIDCWAPVRFFRALSRDKLPVHEILKRFSAQTHLFTQYREKNVDIQRVHNRGSIRALEKKLTKLLSHRGY